MNTAVTHDSRTCSLGPDGSKCSMCSWASLVETRNPTRDLLAPEVPVQERRTWIWYAPKRNVPLWRRLLRRLSRIAI